jgi:hypothetical protein
MRHFFLFSTTTSISTSQNSVVAFKAVRAASSSMESRSGPVKTPAQAAVGRSVTTVAGLMEDNKPNRLQSFH